MGSDTFANSTLTGFCENPQVFQLVIKQMFVFLSTSSTNLATHFKIKAAK